MDSEMLYAGTILYLKCRHRGTAEVISGDTKVAAPPTKVSPLLASMYLSRKRLGIYHILLS